MAGSETSVSPREPGRYTSALGLSAMTLYSITTNAARPESAMTLSPLMPTIRQ